MQEEQETIEAHYNIWAERYEENSRVREERSEELISLLHRHVWLLPSEGWADIGCRSGETLARAAERELLRPAGHWGFDPSERMLSLARDHYPRLARWTVADPADLPLPDGEARGAIVNGGWQWLHRVRPHGIRDGMREARRILRSNSLLALAHPGRGSDSQLLRATREMTEDNPAWAMAEMRDNPLGGSRLDEILQEAEAASFTPVWAEERYEPAMYSNLSLYLEEIFYTSRAAWLAHIEPHHQEAAWADIEERLAERARDGFLRPVFSLYALLRAS